MKRAYVLSPEHVVARSSPFGTIPLHPSPFLSYSRCLCPLHPFLSRTRWWQVIRYLQPGSRARWKRARWALLSTTEQNPPAGLPGFVLTRDRGTRSLQSRLQLTNYPISRTSFSRGWKVCKIILIASFLLSLKSSLIFGIFNLRIRKIGCSAFNCRFLLI